jgi:hypothetical protein
MTGSSNTLRLAPPRATPAILRSLASTSDRADQVQAVPAAPPEPGR